jgi:hypothetical protein
MAPLLLPLCVWKIQMGQKERLVHFMVAAFVAVLDSSFDLYRHTERTCISD